MNEDRAAAFADEIADLKLKGASRDRERWLLLLGGLLLVAGVVLAVIGGVQASGTTDNADQIAYIATASLIGLVLVVAGAALFVRYSTGQLLRFWLVRLVHEQRTQTDRLVEALDRVAERTREHEPS